MYVTENSFIQRYLEIKDGRLYTSHFHGKLSGEELFLGENSAEFKVLFTDGKGISSNELTVSEIINENGRLTFCFNEYDGLKASVSYWSESDSKVLKKQIEFTDAKHRKVDSVLLECLDFENANTTACAPDSISGRELSGYHSALGQPFFADSFFFGSEFPASENSICDGVGRVIYYSGKSFQNSFKTPVAVVGSGKSSNFYDMRSAFLGYIESIAQPVDFRLQYNSWYDGMLEIDEAGILKTFGEVAKQFKEYNLPTPDAYTVDDGWNDYKAPFWCFNKKFPTALQSVSLLTAELGSSLGFWFGPRGGYNYPSSFAKRMQRHALGAYNPNSHDICIADKTYQKNAAEFLLSTVSRLDLSYLKLDGFCLKPCTKKRHNHTVGGKNDMYFITEMWEGWTDIFTSLRAKRESEGKSLWINMTCYVNPSPWWLKYVNSIWLQNSSDIDFSKAYKGQTQADEEITYRDSRYYEFLKTRKFCFPLCHIYNHEPIYGISANVKYSDEEFEKYLMFSACRGQSLNELHLSCSIMSEEKWKILSKVINWQKANYSILRHAVFIGENPEKNNAYAYCSFTSDGKGIAAVRNPSDQQLDFTLSLDNSAGCLNSEGKFKAECVFGRGFDENRTYSYGDRIEFSLKPFEVLILSFNS